MRITGIILALGYYLSMLVFLGNYAAKALTWAKGSPAGTAMSGRSEVKALLKGACDILFLRRLLMVNDVLWIGEWTFHVSFGLVILRHLRYFLDPVPQWVWAVQTPGIIAGYILPFSLVYVLVVKYVLERKKYFSTYNFLLLVLMLVLSISGLLMKTVSHPDIVSVKTFVMGMVAFSFAAAPESALFIFHFITVLVLIANLPTHIFAAPLVLFDARQRESDLRRVVHEE
jgi:nitrate reductase gamma subunit